VEGAYLEGNTTDYLFDSGAVGNWAFGGADAANVTDNSGNGSNMVWTQGTPANQGGNSPKIFPVNTLRLGGNGYAGSNVGADLSLANSGADGGVQLNMSAAATSTYGRTGGAPFSFGRMTSVGGGTVSGLAFNKLPDPAAPVAAYTGTSGTGSYTYYYVCYTSGGVASSNVSPVSNTVTGAATTLNSSNYVTITVACGAGYTGAAILKGGTSGTVELAGYNSVPPNGTYQDTGQSLSAYTPPTRNSTADITFAGYLTGSKFFVSGATPGHGVSYGSDGALADPGYAYQPALTLSTSGLNCAAASLSGGTLTIPGCSPPNVVSGTVTGSGTTASHTFTTAFSSTPQCTATPTSNAGAFYLSALSTSAFTITYATSGAQTFGVICIGSGGVF
jgi:hypothetical protein